MPNGSGARGPLLLERSEPNSPVRRGLRWVGLAAGASGALFVYFGIDAVWTTASVLAAARDLTAGPLGALPALMFVAYGVGGLVLTAIGAVLVAMGWAAVDGPARWRGRRARSPDPEQLHRPRVPRA